MIRPADKGSGIVILNKQDYIKKVENDLNDNTTYNKVNKDILTTVNNKVKKLVKNLHSNGHIDDKTKKYMMPGNIRYGKVKANPKVHKKDNPIRTIISTINSPTEKLAEVAESELSEWIESLDTYVKDTTHFLRILNDKIGQIPDNATLFTMDVKALYPSVPRKEGIQACKLALENRKRKDFTTDALIGMIELVLDNNIFKFQENKYLQTDGTAIGSKLGRNYACTYMGEWEKQLLKNSTHKPYIFLRYVDDIFGIWTGSEQGLQEFVQEANRIHENIKVTLESSQKEIPFLDVLVTNDQNRIKTTIYQKDTDRHMYVHKKSDHPAATKKAIPYGLGIRAKQICSTNEAYLESKGRIIQHLKKRGYNKWEIAKSLNKVDTLDRQKLLEQNKERRTSTKRIPLLLTYGTYLPNVTNILRKRMAVLRRSPRMTQIFVQPPMAAYRRDANLQDILVHSKHRRMFEGSSKPGTQQCGKSCVICQYMYESEDQTVKEADNMRFLDIVNCKSTNVVYGIVCKECDKVVYVGETGNTIYERFQNHISSIKRKKDEPISRHFNGNNHNLGNMKILGLEALRHFDIHQRKIRESFWIQKLQTISPAGLNQNKGVGDLDRGVKANLN